jgi:two-component system NtrC family sensor kinase
LLLLSGAAVLLVGFVSGAFIWTVVRRPVNKLMAGMEMVSTGRLDQRLEARTNDELGRLALKFNEMTSDLARARREITEWSGTLEQKVEEKTAELEKAHKQMLRVEKMASLGNLASSVAHELNNPLEGILTFARLLMKRIQKSALPAEEAQSYYNDLKLVAEEAQRCGDIVKNLLLFSRQKGMAFQVIHVKAILDRCCLLVKHYAAMNNVELRARCTNDDELECDPGQVQQVLVALMMNGIEAMSTASDRAEGGVLSVDVCRAARGDDLTVHVSDTGMGISDDVKRHMFEPFFTTKSEGKGVGLGLAITYGIVERHHGSIEVESTVGRGTTFTVVFPARQPVDDRGRTLSSSVEGVHK